MTTALSFHLPRPPISMRIESLRNNYPKPTPFRYCHRDLALDLYNIYQNSFSLIN